MHTGAAASPSAYGVTGVILAGGRGSRMDGADKGLVTLAGRPMIEHVLQALAPQVERLMISANRNLDAYRGYGHPVTTDADTDFQGPLAGVVAALAQAETELVAFVPCDAPAVPADLIARLRAALRDGAARVAAAHDGERLHPAHSLVPTELRDNAAATLAAGERRIAYWLRGCGLIEVDFSDAPEAFINVNTPAERDELAARVESGTPKRE